MELDYLKQMLPEKGRVLDLGDGDGVFCSLASQNGWKATCVDPALPHEKISDGNPRCAKGHIQDLPQGERCVAITLWDVIEHVESPKEVLGSAVARLNPGGSVIVETGNYQCAERNRSGRDWWCYQSDHRWYFSPPVMRKLMEDAGLVDIELHDKVLRPWWSGRRSAIAPSYLGVVKSSIKNPAGLFRNISTFVEMRDRLARWPDWSGMEIFAMSGRLPE